MKKKIVYVSGTRADFGLMTSVLGAIEKSDRFKLQILATGMHLMPEFGLTIKDIRKKYPNVKKIRAIFKKDSKEGMAQFIAEFIPKFIKYLKKEKFDLLLVLGDRVEMLAAALCASYFGIPIAHIHGGDKTTTVDDLARHAITKLAHVHFAVTSDSAGRIKKLGEENWRIHTVGAPSLDNVLNQNLPSKSEVYRFLKINPDKKYILVLQHPVTDLIEEAENQMKQTLIAVKSFDFPAVVVYPNADPGGKKMIQVIEKEKNNASFRLFRNIDYGMFLGIEREAAVWVGNSSAGIIESASFKTPVVNTGERQQGRPQSGNVINVTYKKAEIIKAIRKSLFDINYLRKVRKVKNIWGDGRASQRIIKVLENLEINSKLLNKQITY